ncbi:kinase-like domain-containing protein, partial [Amylocarpus encephaloides]
SYAIKCLRQNNSDKFKTEVSNLKRFSQKDHLHLIKLLMTFEYQKKFYLLFPWADGNLLGFWKDHPEPFRQERDHKTATWFSKQCLGIVEGLNMIHKADIPMGDDEDDTPNHQTHRRHGDLKPENILWFRKCESSYGRTLPVLKIFDFGLTRFHRTRSMSHIENVAVSLTYRPPEHDLAKMVSQNYDIWTLGCLLLEFVTWYLLGWESVDEFSKARTTAGTNIIWEDVFFQFD